MGEKLVVGPIDGGQRTNRTAFIIDNDSFPTLTNAYQWRGRVLRKRGTSLLGRLQRNVGTTDGSGNLTFTIVPNPLTSGLTQITIGTDTFTDPGGTGTVNLLTNGSGSGTITYSTGVIVITGSKINTAVNYYPGLPVMGLEDFIPGLGMFPSTIGFDTRYSYNISGASPSVITDVSFYKNPLTNSSTMPNYVRKSTLTPLNWNGQNYQQFWTTNYQGSMWATNGITVPYTRANIGMQFKPIVAVTVLTTTTANLQITAHGLVVGDFVFVNEVVLTTGINFQTGYVTTVVDADHIIVTFPFATLTTNGTLGIAQYLTNTVKDSDGNPITKDCIRWYDGNPAASSGKGWVNFAPPLSEEVYQIADNPEAKYYLVGARMVLPFKDRLLFFGPVIQASTAGSSPIYCQDTIIYSQNGTPYYTASYTNEPDATKDTPTSPLIDFHALLVPDDQSATSPSWFEDTIGFGGFFTSGLDQPIISVAPNEDVLLIGFNPNFQSRLTYTGNDLVPFNLFIVNSEFGSSSTFSSVIMDKGVLTRGGRGFVVTSQTGSQRFDLQIPDNAFQISIISNGSERMCAVRDFEFEWVYFTYRAGNSNTTSYPFPTQSILYNYRDESFAIINECYTTYGIYRRVSGLTWATIGTRYPTWASWTDPWNSSNATLLNPQVIGGNHQGFVLIKDIGTGEGASLFISNITITVGPPGSCVITSPFHQLNNLDFVLINGCTGTTQINGNIYQVRVITANTFQIDNPDVTTNPTGTYTGGGTVTRCYIPNIMTKQFPVSWGLGRKTRLGPQQYLFSNTEVANSQIALLIFLSQNSSSASNKGPIVPSQNCVNNSLIYSTVLYTCPESTNIGLTPSNINLNMITASEQQQIWHRMNTSLLGDTVQIGFTIADEQMFMVDSSNWPFNAFAEVDLHSFILDVNPSQLLS
jgi:hypothetical protein